MSKKDSPKETPEIKDVTEMRAVLKAYVDSVGTQKNASESLCIPQSQISEMMTGRREITEKVAKQLGYHRVFMYEKTS